jgi:hypothetical protein
MRFRTWLPNVMLALVVAALLRTFRSLVRA